MISGTVGRRGGRTALGLVIGLLVGGAVGAGATYLVKRGKDGIPGGPRLGKADEMDFVPADAAGFVHVRVRDLWHTEALAEFRKFIDKAGPQAKALIDDAFVPAPSTLDRMTLVFVKTPTQPPALGQPPKGKGPLPKGKGALPPPAPRAPIGNDFLPAALPLGDTQGALVLAFSTPFDASAVRNKYFKASGPAKHGDREYWYDPGASVAAYFPSDTVMVLSDGDGMKAYLARLGNPNGLLSTAIELAREGSRHVVVGLNFGHLGVSAAVLDGAPEEYKQAATTGRTVLRAESLTIGFAIGEEPKLDVRLKYKDAAGAAESETALRELAKIGREKVAEPKKQMEAAISDLPHAPSPAQQLPRAIGSLIALAALNTIDEGLAAPPLKTEGSEVVLAPKVHPTLYVGSIVAAITALGSQSTPLRPGNVK